MKKIAAFILLFVSTNVFGQNDAVEDTAAQPAITTSGKPNGKIAEMKMNKDGGKLVSGDGMVELIIPSGALSKKTTISIQPITNMAPNGNGSAYRLEPSGIEFQKPVQLLFHYDPEETADSMQLLLGIAMQDAKGQWYSLKKFTLDTVSKTISGNINHFSDWTNFNAIKLYPSSARLKVKKILDMAIDLVSSEGDENLLTSLGGSAGLSPMQKMKIPWRATWRANEIINGNTAVGKIVRQSRNTITYEAPATLPAKNPVAVTADINGLTYKYKGIVFKDLKLVSNILIYDVAYEVTMISEIQDPSGTCLGASTYKDTGSFVVSLNGTEARIIEKVNKNISASLNYSGGRCWNYRIITPGTGNIHIAGTPVIKVTPPAAPGRSAMIEISFRRNPAILPLFEVTCKCDDAPGGPITSTNGKGIIMMAGLLPSFPQLIEFEAKEGEQTILEHGQPGGPLYTKFTVKQIKED